MKEQELSAAQKAAVERIRVLMKEYTLAMRPSFLYTQQELLKNIERDLSKLDEEYISKHKIPEDIVKGMATEIYDILMKRNDYDRAITLAEHYKL